MQQRQANFTYQEHDIFYRSWLPDSPKGVILVCHGIAEHSGRYQHVAEYFVAKGFAVYAQDHIGHGKSSGKRMHIGSFEAIIQTVDTLRQIIDGEHPDLPLVLLGHSMGGLIAANYICRYQQRISACALSAPALAADIRPPDFVIATLGVLSKALPNLGLLALDSSGISRDENEVQKYLEDPLVISKKVDMKSIVELDAALQNTFANAKNVELPVLIQHGEADIITNPQGSKDFFEKISSTNKAIKLYPELFHEIFNEPERDQVLNDLYHWISNAIA